MKNDLSMAMSSIIFFTELKYFLKRFNDHSGVDKQNFSNKNGVNIFLMKIK